MNERQTKTKPCDWCLKPFPVDDLHEVRKGKRVLYFCTTHREYVAGQVIGRKARCVVVTPGEKGDGE